MREINKKPFSVGLYIEGLRQLRIVGILGAILLFCSSAITVVGKALSTQRQMELYQDSSIVLANLSALEVAPLLLLLFSVFAPVMTLWLFHFIRHSTDSHGIVLQLYVFHCHMAGNFSTIRIDRRIDSGSNFFHLHQHSLSCTIFTNA